MDKSDFNYEHKYLKYKLKYLNELDGGGDKYVTDKLREITENIYLQKKESRKNNTNFQQIFDSTINNELANIDCKRIYKEYYRTKRILGIAIKLADVYIKSNPNNNEQYVFKKEFIDLQSVILDLIKDRCSRTR